MERLTVPDERIDGGLRRAIIDAREVRKEAMTIYWRLKKYEDTGLTPEEINGLIELLRDKCWACENGKPYKIGAPNLMTCKYMECLAETANAGCHFWKLKHLK